MSLRELNESGMLLPKDEWGSHDLRSTVSRAALICSLLLGLVAIALMYLGSGGTVTMVGIVLFLVFMVWITHISVGAVDRLGDRFDAEAHSPASDED